MFNIDLLRFLALGIIMVKNTCLGASNSLNTRMTLDISRTVFKSFQADIIGWFDQPMRDRVLDQWNNSTLFENVTSEIFNTNIKQAIKLVVSFLQYQDFGKLLIIYDEKYVVYYVVMLCENTLIAKKGVIKIFNLSFKYDALELFLPLLREYSSSTVFLPINIDNFQNIYPTIDTSLVNLKERAIIIEYKLLDKKY